MGDFNVTRFVEERNRPGPMSHGMTSFSNWIEGEGLLDVPISNHAFTWSNLRESPALARLDRILLSAEWESHFSRCLAEGLPQVTSDHIPILLFGVGEGRAKARFCFEAWWPMVEGFHEVVAESWAASASGLRGAHHLSFKLKHLRRRLQEWAREACASRGERRSIAEGMIASMDRAEESRQLAQEERVDRQEAKGVVASQLKMEEAEWRQKSKALWLKSGDNNTRWFLAWVDGGLPGLIAIQREALCDPFLVEEVKRAVLSAEGDKAPGPDGFTYSHESAGLAYDIRQRGIDRGLPIGLPPRHCLQDSFVVVKEMVSALHKDGRSGIALKLDFAKAYYSVHSEFLYHVLALHDFGAQWIRMLSRCFDSAHGLVLFNGVPHGFFLLSRGLRQECAALQCKEKCALLPINVPEAEAAMLARIVGCPVHNFLAHVSLVCGRLKKADWEPLVERF
ncbi:hypothetical protein QJS04_geneDACA013389 [Acorus gramineus]|uniref:Reverse transcriptase domain-containing protein n=1 Tax=Acorus gramineus TaxID=55184 RepID=A0AAV9AAB1_ACOGR|nr:hypothetical protein QJS04_geneDACA013389 [Acorus gramineus]